jgi:hypothetical protein
LQEQQTAGFQNETLKRASNIKNATVHAGAMMRFLLKPL